ncbi:unnamed protein product [Ascophyllum nodosum]
MERAARRLAQAEQDDIKDGLSMWELEYSFQDPVGMIRIAEDWSGEGGNGIAGLQWLGGVVLSRYMDSRQVFPEEYFEGRRVIEVGAGCGLTSIYAALRGADVTITDMDIEKCLENVEANLAPRGMSGNARIRQLRWASKEDLAKCEPPYDILIAGDCLYEEACIAPLLQTMWALAGPKSEILLCGVVGYDILDGFLSQVDSYFYRETVDTSTIDTLARVPAQNASGTSPASSAPPQCRPSPNEIDGRYPRGNENPRESGAGKSSGDGADRPGQRALLRLRKKFEATGQGGGSEGGVTR